MRDIANIIGVAGAIIFFTAYVWAFVLSSRVPGRWLLGMLFCSVLVYPIFAYKNWAIARNNAKAIGVGILLFAISFGTLAITHNP